MEPRFAACLRALTLVLSCSLHAAANGDEASALFERGRAAMKEGDCRTAISLLGHSQELDPAVGTALNLALCEQQTGDLLAAIRHFSFVVDRAKRDDARRSFAERRVRELENRIADITVELAAGVRDAQVWLDGSPLDHATNGAPIRVNPGLHELELRAPGQRPLREKLDLREGERRMWLPHLPDPRPSERVTPRSEEPHQAPERAPPRSPVPAPSGSSQRTWGYVLAGVGTAAVATSVVLGAMVLEKKREMDRNCDDSGGCNQRGLDAANAGRTLATISTITGAVGVPALGLGGYLLLTYEPARDLGPKQVGARFSVSF